MDARKLFIVLIITLFAAAALLVNGLTNTEERPTHIETYWTVTRSETIREKIVENVD